MEANTPLFQFLREVFSWGQASVINTWHSQRETDDKEILELSDHDLIQADHVLHVPLLVPRPNIMVLDHHE